MQYHGNTSEESLLAADDVTLHIIGDENIKDVWHLRCRVTQDAGRLTATIPSDIGESRKLRIPNNATVNQPDNADGVVISFPVADAT